MNLIRHLIFIVDLISASQDEEPKADWDRDPARVRIATITSNILFVAFLATLVVWAVVNRNGTFFDGSSYNVICSALKIAGALSGRVLRLIQLLGNEQKGTADFAAILVYGRKPLGTGPGYRLEPAIANIFAGRLAYEATASAEGLL